VVVAGVCSPLVLVWLVGGGVCSPVVAPCFLAGSGWRQFALVQSLLQVL